VKPFAPRDNIVASLGTRRHSLSAWRWPGVELQKPGRRGTDHPIAKVGEQLCWRASTTHDLSWFGA
jgi:hypothetical protein